MPAPELSRQAASWYSQGEAAFYAGQLPEAEQALWECIVRMPSHAAALHLLGHIRSQQGQPEEALRLQQRSVEFAPELGWNAFAAAELLEQRQQWDAAHAAFRHAEHHLPKESWIGRRRMQAEGLAALGGERLADGLSASCYRYWCRHLEPPLPSAELTEHALQGWFVDRDPNTHLRPGALTWIQMQLQSGTADQADLLTCDEDIIDSRGERLRPWFKPAWHDELVWATPWLDGMALWRHAWLSRHGLVPPGPEATALQRWQWQLFALRHQPRAQHLSRILVHRAAEPHLSKEAQAARADLLETHLRESGESAVTVTPHGEGHALIWAVPRGCRVTLIVCSRDRPDLLTRCLGSIENKLRANPWQGGLQWDWLIVDNGSRLQATADLLAHWQHRPGSTVRCTSSDTPFNWSVLNNHAAKQSTSDLLLFLNNDVCATNDTSPHWLTAMAGMALRPQVGAAGACLLDANGRIQHAGLIPSMGAGCEHPYRHLPPGHDVHRGRSRFLSVWPAITGACLMVRRELFWVVDGFNPALPVEGNDVEFCLQLSQQGLHHIVVPEAILEHHEGSSRGLDSGTSRQWIRAMHHLRRRWPEAFHAPDPCWPAACSLETPDGRPLELAGRGWL